MGNEIKDTTKTNDSKSRTAEYLRATMRVKSLPESIRRLEVEIAGLTRELAEKRESLVISQNIIAAAQPAPAVPAVAQPAPATHEDAAPTDDNALELELESVYSAIGLAIGELIPPFDGEKDIDGNDLSIANARGILQELSYGHWQDFDPRNDDDGLPSERIAEMPAVTPTENGISEDAMTFLRDVAQWESDGEPIEGDTCSKNEITIASRELEGKYIEVMDGDVKAFNDPAWFFIATPAGLALLADLLTEMPAAPAPTTSTVRPLTKAQHQALMPLLTNETMYIRQGGSEWLAWYANSTERYGKNIRKNTWKALRSIEPAVIVKIGPTPDTPFHYMWSLTDAGRAALREAAK